MDCGGAISQGGAGTSSSIPSATDHEHTTYNPPHPAPSQKNTQSRKSTFDLNIDAIRSGALTPSAMAMQNRRPIDFDDYFVGPIDLDRHSKYPYFLRLHGSVTPRMILPLALIGAWATLITCISKFVTPLGVSTLLLTVLDFVIGLALSFRSSSAYERYSDGRKSLATLSVQSRNLARYFWVHIEEREGELGKDDLLAKLFVRPTIQVTLSANTSQNGINLILAFAVALKHKLRFEPFSHYEDLAPLISHLETFAHGATSAEVTIPRQKTPWKRVGEFLGLPMAVSNPRKAVKASSKPIGNLPNEILAYLSAYVEGISSNGTLKNPVVLGQILTSMAALPDVQASAERVLTTPLPVGYNILISQIVFLYVYLLPFQLFDALGWIAIPGCVAAAYIIIGLAAIGNELENPFGNDVNDLPLDQYCEELRRELDFLTSTEAPRLEAFFWGAKSLHTTEKPDHDHAGDNKVLWPLSKHGAAMWKTRSTDEIRNALRAKVIAVQPGSQHGESITRVGSHKTSNASTLRSGSV